MAGKAQKIKKRWFKFIEEYIKDGDRIRAYLAAGYKAKSEESARVASYNLLRKIEESIEWREKLRNIIPDLDLGKTMKELLESKDPRVRVSALGIATKCFGWQQEHQEIPRGITVVINQLPLPPLPEEEEKINAIKPIKYQQITD